METATIKDVVLDLAATLNWRDSLATGKVPHYFGSGETQIEGVEIEDTARAFRIYLDSGEAFRVYVDRI